MKSALIAACVAAVVSAGSAVAATKLIDGHSIKNHTIPAKKLTEAAVASLQGARGPRGETGATGATGATGPQGPPGTNGTAYALVNPNNGSPQLVAGNTSGFTSVNVVSVGHYCLTPAPGVDVVHTAAVASQEAFYSSAIGFVFVRYQPNSPFCAQGQLEVRTFDTSPALSNNVAFTVNVP